MKYLLAEADLWSVVKLIKKDLLIIKNQIPIIIGISLGIPVFLANDLPEEAECKDFVCFGLALIYTVFILIQSILQKESKYKEADSFMISLPYSRRAMVCSRYVLYIAAAVFCIISYCIESTFISRLSIENPVLMFLAFGITTLLYAVYMPVNYKIGFEKTKYYFMAVLMISPISFAKMGMMNIEKMSFINCIPSSALCIFILMISAAALIVSMNASAGIYSNKEF